MGSPLGPTLANFFLGCLEEKIFQNDDNNTLPKIYLRYIDDVFACFENENDCTKFLDILNSQHKDIRFTVEKATRANTLSFLDVNVQLLNNGYETCVWRKATNTGLVLNFNAVCPKTWKSGLILCFLHRAKTICSNWNLYVSEVNKLRAMFRNNGYPDWFINHTIKRFEDHEDNKNKTVEKDFLFTIGLPYFGNASHQFKKRLSALVKLKFGVDINVYFTSLKTGSYFQLKCRTPNSLMSKVVYKFTCLRDANISYIGMTTRHLSLRVKEHIYSKTRSAVGNHIDNCSACKNKTVDIDDFKIIRTCNTNYSTKIQEALLIKKQNPKLNLQLYAKGSSFLLNVF